MPINPEHLKKVTRVKEQVKNTALILTPKLQVGIDTINSQNMMIASSNGERAIFTLSAAAALFIDLKREKNQIKRAEQQILTERVFWGSLEREAAKAGEERKREDYIGKIQPIPPREEGKFQYINPEDAQKAKHLMNQTIDIVTTHPKATNINSACYIIRGSDKSSVALEIRPSDKDKKSYTLSYLNLNTVDSSQPYSIDRRIIWHDDGSAIAAYEIKKWSEGKTTKSRSLSIEELEALQKNILSSLPEKA